MLGIYNLRTMISALAFVGMFTSSMLVTLSQNEDVEGCEPVVQALSPCLSFIKGRDDSSLGGGGGDKPSQSCCNGVRKLADKAKTKADKVALCECIKRSLSMIGPYDPSRIALIPKACGISVQIPPISNSTDCSKAEGFQFGSATLYELGNNHHH